MAKLDVPQVGHVQQDNPEVTEPIDKEWPEGTAYHINSRRLKTRQIRRIAAALGVTVGSASAEDTRTIVEGKLREMDKNPTEVQVIVQGSDDDSGTLFLINDEGVILTVEAVIDSHVTGDEVESNAGSRSALRSEHVSRSSSTEPSELEATIEELRLALDGEEHKSAVQLIELTSVREALTREKPKVKRMWRQRCEQLLTHEDQQEAKDAEIRALKMELARLRVPRERVSEHSTTPVRNPVTVTNVGDSTAPERLQGETAGRTRTSRVGKAPSVDTFTGEMSYGRIGCQHLSVPLIGTIGVRTKSCYSWQVTLGRRPYKNGIY